MRITILSVFSLAEIVLQNQNIKQ